jgi:hypothetical protein
VVMARLLARFLQLGEGDAVAARADQPIRNWNGIETGRIRAAEALNGLGGCRQPALGRAPARRPV